MKHLSKFIFFNIYKTSKNYLIGLVKLKVLIYDLLKKKEFIKPTQNPGDHSGGRKPDGSQPLDINGVKHNLNIISNHYLSCIKKKNLFVKKFFFHNMLKILNFNN